MSRRVLFCEGVEDLAALRELVQRVYGYDRDKLERKRESYRLRTAYLDLIVADSRQQVASKALDLAETDSATDPIARIGLSFDPNGDEETAWRAKLERQLTGAVRHGQSYLLSRAPLPEVALVPLPWTWPRASFYGLPTATASSGSRSIC